MLEQDYEKTDSDCMDENILEFECQENNTDGFQESFGHTSEKDFDVGEDWTDYTPGKLRTPISPELSSTTHQKSLDTLFSPNIFAISDAGSDDELKKNSAGLGRNYLPGCPSRPAKVPKKILS
ncbi:hypothetical protein ACI65C_013272 [Semiaphis heraclei]